ncbi:response regulator [Sagittula sp. NFXS13]|uniref:response regulator n=1 Tax=Sagittula sp. NFXS13 TaxID=2819095 RepID=UPI0032DFC482
MRSDTGGVVAMCIDDEAIDLKLNRRVLKRTGLYATILDFVSAEAALEHLSANPEQRIDVIFLDINMPRMNGFDFLEAIKTEFRDDLVECVVIMLTTSLHPKDQARAEAIELVREYLNKPLTDLDARRIAIQIGEQRLPGKVGKSARG